MLERINLAPFSVPPKWLPKLAEKQLVFILNWSGHDNPVWEESLEEIA